MRTIRRFRSAKRVVLYEPLENRCLLSNVPIITEFLARNDGGLRDGEGRAADWVEVHNPTNSPIQLGGYHLTDDPAEKTKWTFPEYEIQPNEYLIVFASDKSVSDYVDADGFFHTTFALRREGEYLGLVHPDGSSIVSEFGDAEQQYPEQQTNVSYGVAQPIDEENPVVGYFANPTPGEANPGTDSIFAGIVDDTEFSVNRGYYHEPFDVEITTDTVGAEIRYTRDGSRPTTDHGEIYTAPVRIDTTTTLRAAAFANGFLPTNVDTQTYIFLDDVLLQDGAGLPETWGEFVFGSTEAPQGTPVPANYEVDPEVVNDPRYANTIKDDLKSLPTVSLVLDPVDLWDEETGIYSNTLERGIDWERAGSIELFNADGTTEFQIDAGVRIHGGFGRRPSATAKHSFRLLFKGEYGASKLNYPWFGEDQVAEFDTIVLRANYNYSWARGNRGGSQTGKDYTLITDRWAAEAQREMGGLPTNGTFVHLYLNGLYWGVYNPNERPDASFLAEHLGGQEGDYDVVAHDGLVDGSITAWNDLLRLVADSPVDYNAVKEKIDIENFIDYMILNQFGGNRDWPQNNWYASRNRTQDGKWQFHSWDAEFFFIDVNHNRISDIANEGAGKIFRALRRDPEFRIDFADRIQKHLFNDGALTPQKNSARLTTLAEPIDRAVVGESARWGDAWMNQVEPARTRDDDWIPRLDELRNEYFPQRNDIVIQQYQRSRIYPRLDPPDVSPTGSVSPGDGIALSHSNEEGEILYTINGEDPRLPGGEINPNAIVYESEIVFDSPFQLRARTKSDDTWSAISEVEFTFFGDLDENGELGDTDIDMFCEGLRAGTIDPHFDLDGSLNVDINDFEHLIEQVFRTSLGDSTLDGIFNSSDLVSIFKEGEYEDGIAGNSTWRSGDWNCDAEFNTLDLVRAFQKGAYVAAARLQQVIGLLIVEDHDEGHSDDDDRHARRTAAKTNRQPIELTSRPAIRSLF